jgi:A/G-specific adenine glycosylase
MPLAADSVRARLLDWYDRNARSLPWRTGPAERAAGVRPDPYKVWLSEVMLQQTTVPHAASYFLEFTRRWPRVEDLASAPDAEVMAAWAGLGYYARARNLIACARAVAREHRGAFPETEERLLGLPGVGPYTAAAIAAIAFDRPANVVDGNVERVMARLHAVDEPLPEAKPVLKGLAGALVGPTRPGDWAQALMDLGATVCRPKAPLCERCPLAADCKARAAGAPETWPRKAAKADRPRRRGAAFVLVHKGKVALERRPPRGLLGGMLGLPTTEWTARDMTDAQARGAAPAGAAWRSFGAVDHVFTHFALTLQVWRGEAAAMDPAYTWLALDDAAQALPSVFRKALMAGTTQLL